MCCIYLLNDLILLVLQHLMDKFGVRRVFTSEGILGKLVQSTCLRSVAGAKVCRKMAFMLSGSNPEGLGLVRKLCNS